MFKEWEKKEHAIVLESHEKLTFFVMDAKNHERCHVSLCVHYHVNITINECIRINGMGANTMSEACD